MQWFRMYSEAVDDDKLRLLAYEDRWHYVAILCLKSQGTLDVLDNIDRRVAVKLGLRVSELDEVKRRLIEVGLIDDEFQPKAWSKRQYESDFSSYKAEKQRRYREKKKSLRNSDVTVTTALRARTEQNRTDTEEPLMSPLQAKIDVTPARSVERLNGKRPMIEQVIAYLNLQARRNYRVVNPNGTYTAHADLVAQRLKEGYTVEQLKDVVGIKSNAWMGDEKMDQYLNPNTLFRKSNFSKYLAEAEAS
jgi:uncharacterized phage protein (TIGR02220 family)